MIIVIKIKIYHTHRNVHPGLILDGGALVAPQTPFNTGLTKVTLMHFALVLVLYI